MRKLLFLLFISLFFISCGSGKSPYAPPVIDDNLTTNPIKSLASNRADVDSNLNIANGAPLLNLSASPSLGSKSAALTIINPMGGSAITVWALAEGNWLWGYTLDNSKDFGAARFWQVINLGNDIALISNFLTNTCIHDEGSGITHRRCDPNNKSQQWQLFAMDNGGIQLKSTASNKCITTDLGSLVQTGSYYSLAMRDCNFKPNFNQQWVFIPKALPTEVLLGYQQ